MIDAATTTAPTFAEMTQDVFETNTANGWFDEDRAFGDDLALIHSEISEMFEAFRDHGLDDFSASACVDKYGTDWPREKMHWDADDRLEDGTLALDTYPHTCKPEGVGSEAADILVRILDTCHRSEVRLKWVALADVAPHPGFDSESTFGSQITSMHLLTSYVTKDNVSFNALIQYLVAFCAEHDIDLQAEFDRKLAYNKTRGYRHGGKRI